MRKLHSSQGVLSVRRHTARVPLPLNVRRVRGPADSVPSGVPAAADDAVQQRVAVRAKLWEKRCRTVLEICESERWAALAIVCHAEGANGERLR
jgi:hypothetical protein